MNINQYQYTWKIQLISALPLASKTCHQQIKQFEKMKGYRKRTKVVYTTLNADQSTKKTIFLLCNKSVKLRAETVNKLLYLCVITEYLTMFCCERAWIRLAD